MQKIEKARFVTRPGSEFILPFSSVKLTMRDKINKFTAVKVKMAACLDSIWSL